MTKPLYDKRNHIDTRKKKSFGQSQVTKGSARKDEPAAMGSEREAGQKQGAGGKHHAKKPFKPNDNRDSRRSGEAGAGGKFTAKSSDKPQSSNDRKKTNANDKGHAGRASTAEDVAIGDRIVVTIKRIGINGEGVGYYKRKAVFIDGAITDEVVKAKVTKVERSYLQAQVLEIEKRSPHRQEPPCPVYEQCGGCQLQHMTYEAQLKAKEEIVTEAFQRYTGIKELPLRSIIGMEQPWHYRNKAQLQVGLQQQELITGLYAQGTHKLIDISECTVQDERVNEVYKQLKSIVQQLNIAPYDERSRAGYLKTIVVRIARNNEQLQVTFVTATDELPGRQQLIGMIRAELPQVISIAHNIHKERSSVIFGPKTKILWGEDRLPETLGSIQFALSPRAFFQLNPTQTVKLYDSVKEAAALTGNELVIDAYCGTGTISLWLADGAREVRGVEIISEAVEDARSNARFSGIDNALFYEGQAEKLIPQWVEQGIAPDVIVVDPPRTGLDASLIGAILKAKPERFVYVSCNPSTLAKDCKELLAGGYELQWVQPVDMFPQTGHVEVVILMVRKEK